MRHRVGHPGRRVAVGEQLQPTRRPARPPRPARGAPSARSVSPSTSRMPAGISISSRSYGGRYWRDEHDRRAALGVEHAAARRPPRPASARCRARTCVAVGRLEVGDDDAPDVALVDLAVAEAAEPARRRRPLDARRRRADARSPGSAPPLQGGADQLPEQRVRAVGPALELGVGLRADPVRVVGELDELDQAPVGRRARSSTKPAVLEAGAVVRVELVAVAVALADDRLAVGLGHLGARRRARRSRRRGASCRPCRSTSRWSCIRSMTGCWVVGSNSVELASVRPSTLRANSIVMHCSPRHSPRHGTPSSRA